jgi:hypothetical protein
MEEKKMMTPLTKGLILGMITVVLSLLLQTFIPDLKEQQKYSWASLIIIFGGIIWACWSYAKDMNGNVTFGNVFAHGFKTTAVLTSISVVFTVITVTLIFPDLKDRAMENAREQMIEQGQLNDTQIDQAIEMTKKFFTVFAIGGVIISNLLIGVIASLIGGGVVKKNPNPTPFESDNLQ